MIKAKIIDGCGSSNPAKVTKDEALLVTQQTFPPLGPQKIKPFRSYFKNSSDAYDMRVQGTLSVPIDFYIAADQNTDRYISILSFVISDASLALNEFGHISVLTNGCQLLYNSALTGLVYLHDALKSNWDFVRFAMGSPSFGTGTASFIASNVVGASEAIIPVINLAFIIPPYGLKLDAGSDQKLIFRIRDDVRAIDGFDIIAYGFDRFE